MSSNAPFKGGNQALSADQLETYTFFLDRYRTFRSYIEHEDKLQGDRMNRTLLVHGFLLASYGLLVQARISSVTCNSASGCSAAAAPYMDMILLMTSVMLPVIAAMGIFSTISAKRGVQAAKKSIISIREIWEAIPQLSGKDEVGLPGLTGGGSPEVNKRGEGAARGLLRYLLWLWTFVFVLTAYSVVGHSAAIRNALS